MQDELYIPVDYCECEAFAGIKHVKSAECYPITDEFTNGDHIWVYDLPGYIDRLSNDGRFYYVTVFEKNGKSRVDTCSVNEPSLRIRDCRNPLIWVDSDLVEKTRERVKSVPKVEKPAKPKRKPNTVAAQKANEARRKRAAELRIKHEAERQANRAKRIASEAKTKKTTKLERQIERAQDYVEQLKALQEYYEGR